MISDLLIRGVCLVSKVKLVLFAEPRQRIHIRMQDLHGFEKLPRPKREGKFHIRCFTAGWIFICFNGNRLFPTFCIVGSLQRRLPKKILKALA